MLRDVNVQVEDGLLGFATLKGTGIFINIGASPIVSEDPVIITGNMRAAKIKERLGLSPLADSTMDSVENGANRIYCIPVMASEDGTVGAIAKTATGGGSCTATGTPYNAYQVKVEITGRGGFNSALFTYTIDGAVTTSEEITMPLTGEFEIPHTGLTLQFTEGTDATESFLIGDAYEFTTTVPVMSRANVLAAINKLRQFSELYEFVHIVGESDEAMWAAVSAAQLELQEQYHKPLWFVLETFRIQPEEKVEDYAFRLEAARKQINNIALQVVSARSLYVRMDGTTREVNNAGIVCGLYARAKVHQSIARTRESVGMGIKKSKMLELRPHGIAEYVSLLDDASFLTFREYDGLKDYYVNQARMICPDGSDYRYAEDTRILQKIIREVRKAGLPLLNEDIDVTDTQGELEKRAKYMEAPLDEMIEADEISDAEITVPEGQDVIMNERFDVVVRYVSRGYLREINVNVGRANVKI